MRNAFIVALMALAAAFAGCSSCSRDDDDQVNSIQDRNDEVQIRYNIEAESKLASAEDFNLQRVVDLLRQSEFKEIAEIEKKINDPEQQLHNLDTDGDGNMDLIKVLEDDTGDPNVKKFRFSAFTNSDDTEGVDIAFITSTKLDNGVNLAGSYYDHIAPPSGSTELPYYESYLDNAFVSGWLFGSWLYGPRVIYVAPYGYYGGWYHPIQIRPVVSYRSYQTTRTVSGVTRSSQVPAQIRRQQASTGRAASMVQSRRAAATQKYQGSSGISNFRQRSGSSPKGGASMNRAPSRAAPVRSSPRPSSPRPSFGRRR